MYGIYHIHVIFSQSHLKHKDLFKFKSLPNGKLNPGYKWSRAWPDELDGTQTPFTIMSFCPHLQCSDDPEVEGIRKEVPLQAQVRFCLETLTPSPEIWGRGRQSWVHAPLPWLHSDWAVTEYCTDDFLIQPCISVFICRICRNFSKSLI